MTSPSTPPPPRRLASPVADLLVIINKLIIKAFRADSREAFQFVILNDTVHVIKYEQALLWNLEERPPTLLGVSGQTTFNKRAPLFKKWQTLVAEIQSLDHPTVLTDEHFSNKEIWEEIKGAYPLILWLPIIEQGKPTLGLWMEFGENFKGKTIAPDFLDVLRATLLVGYASAYEKFRPKWKFMEKKWRRKALTNTAVALLFLLFLIRVPLRVVAPCEIVPKDPILVTAPLDGIIKEIKVKPGEEVKKDHLLAEYDKRVPLQTLKAAQKQVEVMQAEVSRAETLGLNDPKSLAELSTFTLKLEKEKIALDLAKYQASLLDINAPEEGIVIMDAPEEWRGKPVRVGEKIMLLGTPTHSKVRMWIPEADNIPLDFDKPVRIFLNVSPDKSYSAKLIYISDESTLHDNYIPSFIADANWIEAPEEIKLGLKGTAVLYGERVSLLYFILRKPWLTLRNLLGY